MTLLNGESASTSIYRFVLTSSFRTNGSVIFASGSPYKAVEFEGKVYEPGQGNNMYIFPGIGMGAILSKARHVTDAMVEQAAIALSSSLLQEEQSSELVYPRLARIREISAQIALAVIRTAQKEVRHSLLIFTTCPIHFCIGFFRTLTKTLYSEISATTRYWSTSKQSNGNHVLCITIIPPDSSLVLSHPLHHHCFHCCLADLCYVFYRVLLCMHASSLRQ